jgi:hypothetical protein
MPGNGLESLIGEQLSAVTFVMDYVQLHFDGAVLTAFTGPTVDSDGRRVQFPGTGSRDALCSLIGSMVIAVDDLPKDRIELRMSQDKLLTIPIDDASYRGPEAAHFTPRAKGQPLIVW